MDSSEPSPAVVEFPAAGAWRVARRALGVTTKTVMNHTMSIHRKLGVRGRAEATAWANRTGVIAPD